MKKFTFMFLAALMALAGYAQLPMAKTIQKLVAPTGVQFTQSMQRVSTPRTLSMTPQATRRAAEDFAIISEQPEGELKTYLRGGGHYYVQNERLYYGNQSGTIDIVWGEDDKVYFKDIVSGLNVGTWVEGTLSADGTTVTVPLGQNLYYAAQYNACIAIRLINYDSDNGFVTDEEATEATFTLADGVLSLQGTGFTQTSLGAVWTDDGTFQDYGDYESVYTEYVEDLTIVTPSAEVLATAFEAPMVATDDNGAAIDATVKVAFDAANSQLYVQGLVQYLPEAWAKGDIDLSTLTVNFPVQFLGYDEESNKVFLSGYSAGGLAPFVMNIGGAADAAALMAMLQDKTSLTLSSSGYLLANSNSVTLSFINYYTGVYIGTLPELLELPEGLQPVVMPIKALYYDGESETEVTTDVQVATDGSDIYFQGLCIDLPEGWVKGTINEDGTTVTIPTGQYVGMSPYGPAYLIGEGEEDENGEATVGDIVFSFDATKDIYTLTNNIYYSLEADDIYYFGVLEAGTMIGEDVDEKWVAANQGYENTEKVTSFTIGENITVTLDKAEGSTAPAYYVNGTSLRLYANNTMTISSTKLIGKIEFIMTGSNQQKRLSANVGSYALDGNVGTWTGEAKDIVFTVPSLSGSQARIQTIKVWYFDYATSMPEIPADLTTDTYQLVALDTYYDKEVKYQVKVGFNDDKVYFQGLSTYLPDAWVRGTLAEDGTVEIPNWYMGTFATIFGNYELTFSGATFTYDKAANQFTCEAGFQTVSPDGNAFDETANVVMTKVNETEATPANPEVAAFTLYYTPEEGDTELILRSYPSVQFNIPTTDVDGNDLLADKMSYVVYYVDANDAEQVLTFTTDLYESLTEDMSEVPYAFDDEYDIYAGGSRVYLNQEPAEIATWKKIGVQSIYRGLGIEHRSEIGWFDIEAYTADLQSQLIAVGISELNNDSRQSAVIYDMQGRRVAQPTKGLYIVNGKKVVIK